MSARVGINYLLDLYSLKPFNISVLKYILLYLINSSCSHSTRSCEINKLDDGQSYGSISWPGNITGLNFRWDSRNNVEVYFGDIVELWSKISARDYLVHADLILYLWTYIKLASYRHNLIKPVSILEFSILKIIL